MLIISCACVVALVAGMAFLTVWFFSKFTAEKARTQTAAARAARWAKLEPEPDAAESATETKIDGDEKAS